LAVTRVLAPTGITPNLVTAAIVVLGAFAAWLFAQPGAAPKVAGSLLFWCTSFLDGCDGEIARLKFQETRLGGWLDLWSDNVVHMMVFAGIGVGVSRDTGEGLWLRLGLMASLGVLLSVSLVSWNVLRSKRGAGVLFTSVARPENAGERAPWLRRLIQGADALSRRDFIFVLIFLAILGWLPAFLWAAAVGSILYAVVIAAISIVQRRS
jgi:phosphatidylglycerophosphate synthase